MRKFLPYLFIFFLISATVFFFVSRSKPTLFHTITVDGKFSISIPEYLSETDSLDHSALLQCQNENTQLFLLVYEETDTSNRSLEVFFKGFSDDLISRIEQGNMIKYYPKKIGAYDAFVGNIRGATGDEGAYYRIVVIKKDNSFYELVMGISENNLSAYDEDISGMINSIVFLP